MELDEIFEHSWQLLERGVQNPKSGFHWPVMGTLHDGGRDLGLRTVVLREADRNRRQLICYTDVRASKVKDLRENSRCVWHGYDGKERVQLRLTGHASLHYEDHISHHYWNQDGYKGRPLYQAITTPGTPAETHDETQQRDLTEHENGAGYQHFAVILAEINYIDYLRLRDEGQDRAAFHFVDEAWHPQWLVP